MTLGDSDVLSTCVLITRTHNISQGLLALLALLLSPQRARESAVPLLPFSLSLFPALLYPLSFPRMPTPLSLHNGPCNQRRVIVTRDAYTNSFSFTLRSRLRRSSSRQLRIPFKLFLSFLRFSSDFYHNGELRSQ